MIAPHKESKINNKNRAEQMNSFAKHENNLYLVSPPREIPIVSLNVETEAFSAQSLKDQVQKLNNKIAFMESLLNQKEQLLKNFHVREQELKAALFYRVS